MNITQADDSHCSGLDDAQRRRREYGRHIIIKSKINLSYYLSNDNRAEHKYI